MLPMRIHRAPVAALLLLGHIGLARAESCAPPLHPRIAEVFYDAAGDDTGHEFVELFNSYGVTLGLTGARLEAGDGSAPGRWTLRWTGGIGDSIAPGARFVIGGALLPAPPQALVTLDLQNGPDAVRMVWPDGAVEVVGYGALEFPEYACGSPAPDVASGQSLARVPDDADGGANAFDFRAAPPSPGHANQRQRDLTWLAGSVRLAAPVVRAGTAALIQGTLENRGAESLAAGSCAWSVREAGDTLTLAGGILASSLAAAETASVAAVIHGLPEGRHRLLLAASAPGDEAAENDVDSLWVRVGLGPLQLTEIQFHPAGGEGEWVEVVNASSTPLELATFGFADRGEHPGRIAAARLEPESLAVLAQDRAALLARFPGLDSTRVLGVSPWPTLNNSDDDHHIADVASLIEAEGTFSDQVPYSAAGVAAGVPLERDFTGHWGPATVTSGTPLEPPRPRASVPGRFQIEPHRLLAGAEARLSWDLPWPRARVSCALYDLGGRPRGVVLPATEVSGRGEQRWLPSELSAGLYLLVLEARAPNGEGSLAVTRPLRVEAR